MSVKTVILCGGKGTRMGKDLEGLPKPLIPVGDKPLLWHIMKYFSYFGFSEFVLCLGYKGDKIKDYFSGMREFEIDFVDTGLDTNTGGRIKRIQEYIAGRTFFATYGDGLSDINLNRLLSCHRRGGRQATLTAVRPHSTFGIVGVESHSGRVSHFDEKPVLDHWINGGFFVFERSIFKYVRKGDILEKHSFGRLVREGQLQAYKHSGFWECMDTYKDNLKLNELWAKGKAPWKVW